MTFRMHSWRRISIVLVERLWWLSWSLNKKPQVSCDFVRQKEMCLQHLASFAIVRILFPCEHYAVLFFFFLVAVQWGIQHISSPTRAWTHDPAVEMLSLNPWTARVIPQVNLMNWLTSVLVNQVAPMQTWFFERKPKLCLFRELNKSAHCLLPILNLPL